MECRALYFVFFVLCLSFWKPNTHSKYLQVSPGFENLQALWFVSQAETATQHWHWLGSWLVLRASLPGGTSHGNMETWKDLERRKDLRLFQLWLPSGGHCWVLGWSDQSGQLSLRQSQENGWESLKSWAVWTQRCTSQTYQTHNSSKLGVPTGFSRSRKKKVTVLLVYGFHVELSTQQVLKKSSQSSGIEGACIAIAVQSLGHKSGRIWCQDYNFNVTCEQVKRSRR